MFGIPAIQQLNLSILSSVIRDVRGRISELQHGNAAPLSLGIFCDEIAICLVDSLSRELPHGSYEQRRIHLESALQALVPAILHAPEAEAIKLLGRRRLSLQQAQVHRHELSLDNYRASTQPLSLRLATANISYDPVSQSAQNGVQYQLFDPLMNSGASSFGVPVTYVALRPPYDNSQSSTSSSTPSNVMSSTQPVRTTAETAKRPFTESQFVHSRLHAMFDESTRSPTECQFDTVDSRLRKYVVDRECGMHDQPLNAIKVACARYGIDITWLRSLPGGKLDIKKYRCGGCRSCQFSFRAMKCDEKWFILLNRDGSDTTHRQECRGFGRQSSGKAPGEVVRDEKGTVESESANQEKVHGMVCISSQ